MNIEEAVNYLKENLKSWKDARPDLSNTDIVEEVDKDYKAIEVLLTAYEKEKDKNKEYEKQLDLDYAEEKTKEAYIDGTNVAHNLCNKKWVEIIQAQIQELENERKDLVYAQPFVDGQIGVLKRVLKRGEE